MVQTQGIEEQSGIELVKAIMRARAATEARRLREENEALRTVLFGRDN